MYHAATGLRFLRRGVWVSGLCIQVSRCVAQQSRSQYCQQARRKDEVLVVVVTGFVLLPAFPLLSRVSPGCFLVAVGVPHLTLGNLLVGLYLDSG